MKSTALLRTSAFLVMVVPFLGGGICGVHFKSAPVAAKDAKPDPALFGTWSMSDTKKKTPAGTMTVFSSDDASTVFFMASQEYRSEDGVLDTMSFIGHPFGHGKHRYLALRGASIEQPNIHDPARAVAHGDYLIARYRIEKDQLRIWYIDEDSSIAAVKSRKIAGTHVMRSEKLNIPDEILRIDAPPAEVLEWLDSGAVFKPYGLTYARLLPAVPD